MGTITRFLNRNKDVRLTSPIESGSNVVSLSAKKDQAMEKRLAICMREIQQLMQLHKRSHARSAFHLVVRPAD